MNVLHPVLLALALLGAWSPPVPSFLNATTITGIQTLPTWVANHDPATAGTSTGSTQSASDPSLSGNAREFEMQFTNNGGEIFHTLLNADTTSTNFVYDVAIYIDDPSSIANIEMDMNQVLANGNTVIYGVQCDGATQTWDYTLNTGTPQAPVDTWIHSSAQCPKPSTWQADVWHYIEMEYERDAVGNVTYDYVTLDGQQSVLPNAYGNSAFALGWQSTLLTNFQIDGMGANGEVIVFVDNMTLYKGVKVLAPSGLVGSIN